MGNKNKDRREAEVLMAGIMIGVLMAAAAVFIGLFLKQQMGV